MPDGPGGLRPASGGECERCGRYSSVLLLLTDPLPLEGGRVARLVDQACYVSLEVREEPLAPKSHPLARQRSR